MGEAIRGLRHAHGLTLVQLAERTGLSHSFLSQIERGLAAPSMKSLFGIASALGTTQDRLMVTAANPAGGGPAVALLRAGDGIRLSSSDDALPNGSLARQLIAEPGVYYPTEFVGLSRQFGEFWFEHDGTEFVYVATGTIEVELGDGTIHTLGPADSLKYDGHIPHRWRAKGSAATRVLMVHTGAHGENDAR
ncbi:MAG TPA: XRE family transcriptional regulator [Mycobacteriales bacterium]|jgi:transcriptional regulator with XRE-family HTH domain|nr:XRE family transcriptional regulator [Mycobacteriales bacterium]